MQYLDGSGGAAVSCLGHRDAEVTAAIKAQLDRLTYAHTSFFTSEPALAYALIAHAPARLERVCFVSGGPEATQTASKLARQHHVENDQAQRGKLIARKQSYHGNTPASRPRPMAYALKTEILRPGPDTVMAFMAEPVVGCRSPPPAPGNFKHIRGLYDHHGALLILNEVMRGMGRTGTLFACKADCVSPDIASIAKGLGAGYQRDAVFGVNL